MTKVESMNIERAFAVIANIREIVAPEDLNILEVICGRCKRLEAENGRLKKAIKRFRELCGAVAASYLYRGRDQLHEDLTNLEEFMQEVP